MAQVAAGSVARQLESLFEGGSAAGLSDRQLTERYVAARDEAAFAALVARHGPMVLGICRQILGDAQHAEDAFQAVFLVLAQKARSIRDPELLGNWLYGVATRTARCARQQIARRRRREEDQAMSGPGAGSCAPAEPTAPPADRPAIDREQAEALHGEVDRLPRAFRLPVVLCYFEGLTLDEAARRLRCPAGTLRSRLARAREKLRTGLVRRGVVLPAAALGTLLAPRSVSASVPPLLCDSTTRVAIAFAARGAASGALSALVAALAQEVLRTMLIQKLRLVVTTVLALAAIATGAGYLAHSLNASALPQAGGPDAKTARMEPRPAESTPPAPGRMIVTGRVLRPDGRPAANVPVDIIAASRAPRADTDKNRERLDVLGRGTADGDGRFRIEAVRASSARHYYVYALAGAAGPGSAFGCVKLDPDAEQPAVEVRLPPEQVIRGKLVDVKGQPAAGVEIHLADVYSLSTSIDGVRFDSPDSVLSFDWPPAGDGLRAWPRPATTDARGRFIFTGVARGIHAVLAVRDPRFAQQRFEFSPGERDATHEVSFALQPPTLIEGRVLAADTGRPIPDATIVAYARVRRNPRGRTHFLADGQGHFRISPFAGDEFIIQVLPPPGQPYLAREAELAWPKGAVRQAIDITLPRGVPIRGRVTEEGTGRPVAGASIQYFPAKRSGGGLDDIDMKVNTAEDGSFQLTIRPGRGHLSVVGPTLDYIPQEMGGGRFYGSGQPGGPRVHAHAIVAYEVRAGDGPREINAVLRPGKTLHGRLVGPAGETVEDAVILSRQQIHLSNLSWNEYNFIHAHDGRFELSGFDPEKAAPVYFLDADHGWGARVELSGKQAGEDLTIRLQPCGQARARFVGPDGQPVARLDVRIYVQILMTPGSSTIHNSDRGESLAAEGAYLPNVDPKHHPHSGVFTDAQGGVTLPALIPGAPYRISDWSTVNVQGKGYQIRRDFSVKPGETLDLGDILVEKPELGR
jgi:RNA polymerase sigma factor (sigma-70 family)